MKDPLEAAERVRALAEIRDARVRDVKGIIEQGALAMAFSTRFDTDHGLVWDAKRGAWVASDGHAFDGERLRAYSRNGAL